MKKVLLTLTMLLFAFTGVMRASAEQGNVRADQVIEQGFEDGLGDWTMNHCHSSSGPTSSYGGNTGNYAFRFYYTANYPQYLISPELDDNDGVNFTFYAARYSSNYPESFKVGYSSTTNEPTEFTWGSEVTCTTMYGAGAYQEYSYDFPAGTKYVSIACTSNDQFYMFVDDITVTATEPAPTPGGIVEVTIGDPTSTVINANVPGYSLYDYAISQQIYTADEIGVAGTINTLTMWLKNSSSYARNINVYMKEVAATEFASNSAWESFTAADMVVSFTMPNGNATPIEVALDLSTPFEYSGSGSLAICFQDVTGQWSSGLGGVVMDASGNQALYAYRDGTVYDPSNPGVNGTLLAKKNVIKLSIMTSGGAPAIPQITFTPDTIDLGYRPIGAWMAPFVVEIGYSENTPIDVTALSMNNNFYFVNAEVPFSISKTQPAQVEITTGDAEEGQQDAEMVVVYNDNRGFATVPVTAYAYNPVDGDVYENAIEVTSFPYNDNAPAGIYKNYALPTETEGADAVYKMTFANDVMLTAGTTGADGVVALYTEDFNGEGGPMADNNYEYNGPTINPGPVSMWFSYSYTGSNTWYGTSAGGGFYFGYQIPVSSIETLGLAGTTITTVEAAARESYPYECYILEGGANPGAGTLIGYGAIENPTALYFFDINLEVPAYISGNNNIWVMFYSDSPYAAYCGRTPVDQTNGKIWTYNPNAASPAWSSNVSYTPVIYTRFLELPTGREVTVNLAEMNMKKGNGVMSEVAAIDGTAMGTPKAQLKQNNNRVVVENDNIEDMYVKAGTYYLVAASTDTEFPVSIEVADVPAPEQAYVIAPYDGETNVTAPYLAEWILGDYTEEMQVLLGTQYPPQTALIDWTSELVESAFIMELEPNQSYFMQVNERNAAGTTMGEIVAFTTPIDPVEGFAVENDELYPGDAAVFTWDANRTFQGYNLYMFDGVDITKVNDAVITTNTYAVEDLPYNMPDGYQFAVTAVYDAGESDYSEPVVVYMTGNGTVSGHVYDTDTLTPIANATIEFRGVDQYGVTQVIPATADADGFYTAEVLAGSFTPYLAMEGYAEIPGEAQTIAYQGIYENVDILAHEYYYPLNQITATEQDDNTVLVEWSWTPAELIIDFETGDLSQFDFTLPATYPWAITNSNAHEGTYAIKSTCEGVASGTSEIEATVDVPFDGKMGFWVKVSSEANYDKFHFYIDGVEKGAAISGAQDYAYKEFDVTEGTHTYKWQYAKDSSVNSNDDCAYVDDITMYRYEAPLPPVVGATSYNFDDNTMMGWTSIDADGDGNGWVSSSNPGIYHNSGVSLAGTGHNESEAYVISGSYANQTGQALTPDNYLVSPAQISAENGAQIQFWACAQDASYAAEHFGVAVSTTTATAAAFTTIQEWTMTAKSSDFAERAVRGTRQGSWYQYSVDLSAYAGQDIWVAIRHFNCTDMFILNVDDITLATGGNKGMRDGRSLVSYNLYRRDIQHGEANAQPELVMEGISADVFEYTDAEWANLTYGEYQWGIAATYEGYAPTDRNRDVIFTDTFEDGALTNWTTADADGDGDTWQNATPASYGIGDAHSGTNCASSWSWNSYTMYPDNWMISPMVDGATSIQYYVATNTAYPDHYGVYASSTGTATSNFTLVFEETAASKGGNGTRSSMTQAGTRDMSDWAEKNITLPEGTKYVAFRHWNSDDMNYLFIDDVTISGGSAPVPPTPPTPGPTGDGISEILWSNMIAKDMEATLTFNVTLNNGQSADGAVVFIANADSTITYTGTVANGTAEIVVRKGNDYTMSVNLAGYTPYEGTDMVEEDKTYNVELAEIIAPVAGLYVSPTGWAMWEAGQGGGGVNPGPGPQPGGTSFTEGFEGGLNGWNVLTVNAGEGEWIHSSDNLGGYDYTELAHDGTGFAMCYSYVDYVGAFNTDSYLYTPQKYAIVNGSTLTFWADNANDSYPENFSVCVATVDNPTAADFTQVWSGGAKGTANGGETVRHQNNRYENWRSHSIDLSAYAGQEVYIAFHDVNYDAYEIWIDDVELGVANKGDRAPLFYVVKLDGVVDGQTENPFFQHNVEGLEEGSTHVTAVRPVYMTGTINADWMEYTWTYTSCENFAGVEDLAAAEQGDDVKLTWTMPEGGTPGPNPNPGTPETFNFDDGTMMGWTSIDGDNDGYGWVAGSQVGGVYLVAGASLAGSGHNASDGLVCSGSYSNYTGSALNPNNFLVSPTKAARNNVSFWACGQDASYVAEHFGVAVSTTGNTSASDFTTVQEWTMTAKGSGVMSIGRDGQTRAQGSWHQYTVDLSAYAGQDIWVAIRHFGCTDMFILDVDDITFNASAKGDRAMWDLVHHFDATSGYQYGVASDGQNIYTSSWSASSTSMFYKYDLQGNFIEEFNISGCGQIRDLTYDGEYFYGVANSSTVYCVDLANHTLVSQFNTSYGAMRCITYDPERQGFWVVGNWTGNLTLIDYTGAIQQTATAPTSASGIAYYKDPQNVEHIYYLKNESGNGEVYEYNITTNTMGTSPVYNCLNTPGVSWTGSSGGCFVGSYEGKTCLFADAQQSPQLICIYELDANGTPGPGPGPGPGPQPGAEGIKGVMIFRDGEYLDYLEGSNVSQYVVTDGAAVTAEYGVRVVYDGAIDTAYYAMSCMETVTFTSTVSVNENNVVSAFYPNPTKDNVTIEATGMKHITVINSLGQVVYDVDVNADRYMLNLSQYKAGLYMVRISSENGVSVKRVTLVK